MNVVLAVHSIVRWLVVIVAVVAVVRYALVMSSRAASSGMDRGLMSAYTGLLDANVLLGLILIVGFLISVRPVLVGWIAHAVINITGVAVAHIFARRAKKMEDAQLKARTSLLGVVISIVIIVVGVALVGGWAR